MLLEFLCLIRWQHWPSCTRIWVPVHTWIVKLSLFIKSKILFFLDFIKIYPHMIFYYSYLTFKSNQLFDCKWNISNKSEFNQHSVIRQERYYSRRNTKISFPYTWGDPTWFRINLMDFKFRIFLSTYYNIFILQCKMQMYLRVLAAFILMRKLYSNIQKKN